MRGKEKAPSHRPSGSPRALWVAISLSLALIGYFAPWVPHRSAALAVTGFELAEFAKFFPQVQGGAVPLTRAVFYLPLVVAGVSLGLFVGQMGNRWVRWGVALSVAGILLAALVPYTVIEGVRLALTAGAPFHLDQEYGRQLGLALIGAALSGLAPFSGAHRWPPAVRRGIATLLTLLACVPPWVSLARIWPLFTALYGHSMGPGWGVFVCAAGFGLLWFTAWRWDTFHVR